MIHKNGQKGPLTLFAILISGILCDTQLSQLLLCHILLTENLQLHLHGEDTVHINVHLSLLPTKALWSVIYGWLRITGSMPMLHTPPVDFICPWNTDYIPVYY